MLRQTVRASCVSRGIFRTSRLASAQLTTGNADLEHNPAGNDMVSAGFLSAHLKEHSSRKRENDNQVYVRPELAGLINSMGSHLEGKETAYTDVLNTGAIVFTGPKGIGKTAALETVVHACRQAGWLTLYLPEPRLFTHGGQAVRPGRFQEKQIYDQPELVLPFLKNLYIVHQEQLKLVTVKTEEAKQRGDNMLELVEHGIRHAPQSGLVVNDIREEMCLATEVPTLVAVDEIDTLYAETVYGWRGVDLWPSNLTLPRAFQDYSLEGLLPSSKLKNGFVVGATTFKHGAMPHVHENLMDISRHSVGINPFSREETMSLVNHLQSGDHVEGEKNDYGASMSVRGKAYRKSKRDTDLHRLFTVSGGIPKYILEEINHLPYGKLCAYESGGSVSTKEKLNLKLPQPDEHTVEQPVEQHEAAEVSQ